MHKGIFSLCIHMVRCPFLRSGSSLPSYCCQEMLPAMDISAQSCGAFGFCNYGICLCKVWAALFQCNVWLQLQSMGLPSYGVSFAGTCCTHRCFTTKITLHKTYDIHMQPAYKSSTSATAKLQYWKSWRRFKFLSANMGFKPRSIFWNFSNITPTQKCENRLWSFLMLSETECFHNSRHTHTHTHLNTQPH